MNQDNVYLDTEADNFFYRNKYNFANLPEKKQVLIDQFANYVDNTKIDNILEIGCHIGDLLDYSVKKFSAKKGYGIEPSVKAVQEGNKRFGKTCKLVKGIASNDHVLKKIPVCDLVIINDVFCWISRDSILRSIANIDEHLGDNGYLIIRDFLPDRFIRNQNMHVENFEVFCHKIIGSHAEIFKQIGNYQLLGSRVFTDVSLTLSTTQQYSDTENRWVDIILQKRWE